MDNVNKSIQLQKIEEPKLQKLLFWLCWIAYFSTYLGRLNYSAALTEIIRAEGFEKGAAGLIGTAFFCAYGIGQLLSGFLGDKLKPQKMIFTGMLGSGICNLFMGFAGTVWQMVIIWCVNGMLQSLIWSPIIKLFSIWIPEYSRKRFCVHINSSVPIGTFAAYAATAFIIWLGSWRSAFFFSAVCLAVICAVWFFGISKIQKSLAESEQTNANTVHKEEIENISIWRLIRSSGIILICIALIMQGALKDGVTTWIPTYIREVFGLDSAVSIISTTVIPIFNLSGVYLAAFVNGKIFKNELRTCGAFFTICAGALLLLRSLSGQSVIITLALFGIATTAMMAVNTMLVSVVPIYFAASGKSSAISGILNSAAYAGGAISTYGIGFLSEAIGWNMTIAVWIVLSLTGVTACIIGKFSWQRYNSQKVYL